MSPYRAPLLASPGIAPPAPWWRRLRASLWSRDGTGQRSTLGARRDARAKRQASARERRAWDEYLDKLDELHALRAASRALGVDARRPSPAPVPLPPGARRVISKPLAPAHDRA